DVRARLGKLDAKLGVRARLAKLDRKHKLMIGAGAAAVLLVIVLAVALSGGDDKAAPASAPAATPAANPDVAERARAYVEQAAAALDAGKEREALTAYQQAIVLAPALAEKAPVVAKLSKLAGANDSALAIATLDLVAQRSGAAGHAALAAHASTHPLADVRRHAWSLAERAGAGARIDRVASFTLDLDQATTCDQRRTAIGKLADTGDPRAAEPLRKAKAHKCVERDADAALQRITKTR
ncbi:MAG TPA: hypothetical protein VIV11_37805, partial [Kofleriaceae bacterium]